MLAVERHTRIRDVVEARRVVSTEDLARALAVSAETVRRDLVQLAHQGHVRRVHGGVAARSVHVGAEPGFEDRTALDADAKSIIAGIAVGLVRSGQTIALDVGTTAVQVARALPDSFTGTVATCSLLVAAELATRPTVEVLIPGGRVRRGDLAVSGAPTVAFFADLRADVAFLGSGGIDAEAGLTDFHFDEVATRRAILAHSAKSYVLADSSKFARIAPHRVCGLDELTGVITDRPLPGALLRAASQAGVEILAA